MVVIRLAPAGKKGAPVYKVTVADKDAKLTGRFIEKLGTYTPSQAKTPLLMNMERYEHWIKLGAQPSTRVKRLIKDHSASAAQ